MSKCKFKTGDRIRVLRDVGFDNSHKGSVGTILDIDDECGDISILIEFDKDIGGHDGDESGKDGHCWWVAEDEIEPICKFKVGDMVIGNSNNYNTTNKGWIGEVTKIKDSGKFEARGRHLFGYTVTFCSLDPKDFDLYTKDQPTKIVITTDGKTTTAKMYRDKSVVKVETTKCHPDDRFDFMVGARVAFDRLVGEKKEEPTYYNGKMVCLDPGFSIFTKSKIYEFVDGQFIGDDGVKYPRDFKIKSFGEWEAKSRATWLEVVE